MSARGKRYRNAMAEIDRERAYSPLEAVRLVKGLDGAKFDETVEAHFRLGLNVRHADQQLRGTIMLPHGIGKSMRVAVFAEGEKAREAEDAGADAPTPAVRHVPDDGAAAIARGLPGISVWADGAEVDGASLDRACAFTRELLVRIDAQLGPRVADRAEREQAAERSELGEDAWGVGAARQALDAADDFIPRFDIDA